MKQLIIFVAVVAILAVWGLLSAPSLLYTIVVSVFMVLLGLHMTGVTAYVYNKLFL